MTETASTPVVTEEQLTALLAEMDQMRAALQGLGAAVIKPPEPRFSTIYGLIRELAARTLGGDVLHEFYAVADMLEADADQTDAAPASDLAELNSIIDARVTAAVDKLRAELTPPPAPAAAAGSSSGARGSSASSPTS